MYKYEIIPYWSDEDRAFVVEVPELPGCVAPVEQVLWIDAAREFGDPIPDPKAERLMLA